HPNQPISNSGSEGKDSTVDRSNGWDDKSDVTVIQRIQAANKKVKLINIFNSYNISIKRLHNNQLWSVPIICPFPSHKHGNERTPSFGYNFVQNRFNCLSGDTRV